MPQDLTALVGQRVAGYHLHAVLGQGASAVVFRGENVASPGIFRAVKVIRPELAASVEFTKRFQAETRILNDLVHENIVRFYGAHQDAALGLLAMDLELLEGRSLAEQLKRDGAPPLEQALSWLYQAARGVAFAHGRGVLHHDLKPDNLFLTPSGHVKILDFGIARAIEDAERTSKLTQEGHVAGTAAYLAPEVWRGDRPTPQADVYALGLTLAEVLLGRHPFLGADGQWPTNHQLMYKHIEGHLPNLRERRAELPPEVETVGQTAVARALSVRYPDAAAFAEALAAVGATAPTAKPAAPPAAIATDRVRASAPTPAAGDPLATGFAAPRLAEAPAPGSAADPRLATDDVRVRPRRRGKVLALLAVGAVAAGTVAVVALGGGGGADPAPAVSGPAPGPAAAAAPVARVEAPEPVAPAREAEAAAPVAPAGPAPPANPWVRVEAPSAPVALGVSAGLAASGEVGFRPALGVTSPSVAYELQQHEVTWAELDAWLATAPGNAFERPGFAPALGASAGAAEALPASGVPWAVAHAYCRSLGARLPTEEEWEFAARGAERRPFPWGAQPIDLVRTSVYLGAEAKPRPVGWSDQDVTPGAKGQALHDLLGNVREWTADLWREPVPGADESWVQSGETSFRAVRGLPLEADAPNPLPREAAAFRDALCATGPCVEQARAAYARVGFRCARVADAP